MSLGLYDEGRFRELASLPASKKYKIVAKYRNLPAVRYYLRKFEETRDSRWLNRALEVLVALRKV